MGHRKQILHLAKVVAAMFFPPHPYIVAPTGATDLILNYTTISTSDVSAVLFRYDNSLIVSPIFKVRKIDTER